MPGPLASRKDRSEGLSELQTSPWIRGLCWDLLVVQPLSLPSKPTACKLSSQSPFPRELDLRNSSISFLYAEMKCRINSLDWLWPCSYTQFN